MNIPFNKPYFNTAKFVQIVSNVEDIYFSGNQKFTKLIESKINQSYLNFFSLFLPSCTHALELALYLMDLEYEDEVVIPSFAFVSLGNSVILNKAKPVYADIDLENFGISFESFVKVVTNKTKAVIFIEYNGISGDYFKIEEYCKNNNIKIICDKAHSFDLFNSTEYKADFICFSFHETKNIHCGEGGVLLISNERDFERALLYREKGTNREKFFAGQVNKYEWVSPGSSLLSSDFVCAFLNTQMEEFEKITLNRHAIYQYYCEHLSEISFNKISKNYYKLNSSCHIVPILLDSKFTRDKLLNQLKERGIATTFHYQPLHLSSYGSKFYKGQNLRNSEIAGDVLLRLPIWYGLSEELLSYIIDVIKIENTKF